jgi:hypothetical protein
MQPGRDWSSDVSDVGKHARADTACDLPDAFEVDDARISDAPQTSSLGRCSSAIFAVRRNRSAQSLSKHRNRRLCN